MLVPELASVLSAFGAGDRRRPAGADPVARGPFPVDTDAVAAVADKLRAEVDADLAADGIAAADRSVHFEADLRFKRQMWELPVPLVGERVDEARSDPLLADFRAEYAQRYGEGP